MGSSEMFGVSSIEELMLFKDFLLLFSGILKWERERERERESVEGGVVTEWWSFFEN
jgi:hypothetical protein